MSIATVQLAEALRASDVFSITFQAVATGHDKWSHSEMHRMVVQREVVIAMLPSGPRPFATKLSPDLHKSPQLLSSKAGKILASEFLSAIQAFAFKCALETHLPVPRISIAPLVARAPFPVNIQVAMGLADTGPENDFAVKAACERLIRRAPAALGVSLKERDRGPGASFGPDEWQSWRDNMALAMHESFLLQAAVARASGTTDGAPERESEAVAGLSKPATRL